jgi:hypothetical protein
VIIFKLELDAIHKSKGKGKGKIVPVILTQHHAMKAYWGVDV